MTAIPESPVILVDGSSYLFRAYYALPPLTNSNGVPTGAIYGVINMLNSLLLNYNPKLMAVVFDTKGKTFRHEMYEEYKANRTVMPEDLALQIEPLQEIIKTMGLKLIAVPGVEADDVIGTLAREAEREGYFTLISTGDKDMAQLVDQNTYLINTMNDTVMDRDGVIEKFGIPPERIIDYLTLVGDTSDNIPGVNKVGPKTAIKWLTEYDSLQGVIDNRDNIKGKVGENFRNAIDDLPLYTDLTTIKTDLDLEYKVEELAVEKPDIAGLKTWYEDLELKRLLDKLENGDVVSTVSISKPKVAPIQKTKYKTVSSQLDFNTLLFDLEKAELITLDLETTSLDYMVAEIVGIAFAVNLQQAYYIPLKHNYEEVPKQLDFDKVLAKLKPILESPEIKKLGHNLKYDLEVLANYDIKLQGVAFDSMLESYIVNSTATRHDLTTLAKKYLNRDAVKYEDVAGKGKSQINFSEVAIDVATNYSAEDVELSLRLHEKLLPELKENKGPKYIFEELEIPLITVLAKMERNGVLIDAVLLEQQSNALEKKLTKLENQAFDLAGDNFNINSPKQLQEILFEKLELPIIEKTPKGAPSTAENVLQELSHDYELPKVILEYRSLSKLKSTYTDKLPELINEKTGRVHTSYHQAVTATGRLSSSDPNLQNIPIRTSEGRDIRKAFIAPKGFKILSADYSQIELRIMAHLSQDKNLLDTFRKGEDVHRATASEVFGVPLDKVTDEERRSSKAINFGLIYGMSAFGLAKQLDISRTEADEYITSYFEKFPGVKDYMESTRTRAYDKGYVETLWGRRLYLPDIRAKNVPRRRAAERAAINAPMQGAQADIIKKAMLMLDVWINDNAPDIKMLMQVHDELVFEVPASEVSSFTDTVKQLMGDAASLDVPLIVGVGSGDNWGDAH